MVKYIIDFCGDDSGCDRCCSVCRQHFFVTNDIEWEGIKKFYSNLSEKQNFLLHGCHSFDAKLYIDCCEIIVKNPGSELVDFVEKISNTYCIDKLIDFMDTNNTDNKLKNTVMKKWAEWNADDIFNNIVTDITKNKNKTNEVSDDPLEKPYDLFSFHDSDSSE